MNNREKFEAFVIKQGVYNESALTISKLSGEYHKPTVQLLWEFWQAATADLGALQIAPDLKIYGTDEALTLAGKALAAYQKMPTWQPIKEFEKDVEYLLKGKDGFVLAHYNYGSVFDPQFSPCGVVTASGDGWAHTEVDVGKLQYFVKFDDLLKLIKE